MRGLVLGHFCAYGRLKCQKQTPSDRVRLGLYANVKSIAKCVTSSVAKMLAHHVELLLLNNA